MQKFSRLMLLTVICFLLGLSISTLWYGVDFSTLQRPDQQAEAVANAPNPTLKNTADPVSVPAAMLLPTLDDIVNSGSEFERSYLAYLLANQVNKDELHDLFIETSSLSRTSDRQAIANIFLQRLVEYDPALAFNLALNSEKIEPMVFIPYVAEIFHGWARTDLGAAIAAAKSLQDEQLRYAAMQVILKSRDDLSGAQIASLVQKFNEPRLVKMLEMAAQDKKLDADPKTAWREALEIPDDRKRDQELRSIGYAWGVKEPRAALEAAASVEDLNTQRNLVVNILSYWAEHNPDEVFDWVTYDQLIPDKESYVSEIFGRIAENHPLDSITVATNFKNDAYRLKALEGALGGWTYKDPQAAISWIQNAPSTVQLTESTYNSVVAIFAKSDPAAAFDLVHAFPIDDPYQAVQGIANSINLQDMERYARELLKFQNQEDRDRAIKGYVFQWSNKNPAEAASWLAKQKFGGSEDIQYAYHQAFSMLANFNIRDAVSEVMNLEPSINKDQAISSVIHHVSDNEVREKLLAMVNDPQKRAEIRYYLNTASK